MELTWKIKPYLIKTFNSPEEIQNLIESASDNLAEEDIMKLDFTLFEEYIEYEFDDRNSIVFLDQSKIEKVLEISKIIGFKLDIREVSKELFNCEFKFTNEHKDFFQMLNDYLFTNFTRDDVLDKILEKGIDSLTDTDKLILSSKK